MNLLKKWKIALFVLIVSVLVPVSFFQFNSARQTSDAREFLNSFLNELKSGDTAKALSCLGSEGCSCSPPGGWSAYLTYSTGLEPNITFLLGTSFAERLVAMSEEYADTKHKEVIHKQAELRLSFPTDSEPFLLPVKLAFGSSIPLEQLDSYCNEPSKDGLKGLTLRLRRTLGEGSIRPAKEICLDKTAKTKDDEQGDEIMSADNLAQEFGADAAYMLFPSDKGKVTANSRELPSELWKNHLPRLKEITLRVDLVRRKNGTNWKIWKCIAEDPSLEIPNGKQIALTESKVY